MKKILAGLFTFTLLALGAYAQDVPKADVSLGYAYVHVNGQSGVSGFNNNGFAGSAAYNITGMFGVVGDFGVYHGSVAGVGINTESYTFGPRFSVRGHDKFVPFVQALFGGAHSSASGTSTNAFAFSFGGGTDIGIAKDGMIALRPQFDYIGLRNNGNTTNTERICISLVFNIGQK